MSTQHPAIPKLTSGPSRHVYDVIVVGGHLGGALSAALLAKRGYRVLLVEHDGMGHGYEHAGYLLPYGPFVAPPLKAMPAFDEALVELGLATTVQRALKPHSPELQLIFPDHRLDLFHEEPKRIAELTREFGPEVAARVNTALKAIAAHHEHSDALFKEHLDLHPTNPISRFTLKGKLKKFPGLTKPSPLVGDDPPSRLLAGLLPFLVYVNDPNEPLAQGRPLSHALMSPNRFAGGREGLREILCRKLVDLGGDLFWRESSDGWVVEELSFEGGKLVGLKLVQSETLYRGHQMIAATDAGALRRLVTDKKKQRALADSLDLVNTKRFLFTVNWVMKADRLPCGMGDLLLMETGEPELGPLLIQVGVARKAGGKTQEDERTVSAGLFVPASARDLGEEHLKNLAQRISDRLADLMPFTRESLVLESAPYLDASGVRGSRLLPHPLYEFQEEGVLGITGLPVRTPVKNLFLASREVFPGLGLEGEILAGIQAAQAVQETSKKTDLLHK